VATAREKPEGQTVTAKKKVKKKKKSGEKPLHVGGGEWGFYEKDC